MRAMKYIYCRNCKKIQPYRVCFMSANEMNPNHAQDIVCNICSWIVAVFHEGKQ